jgi:arabinofuranan 3-O-arabinosyltransferase
VEGSLARALTGRALAVRPCGSATVALPAGPTRLTAEPGSFAVADTIDLVRQGSAAATAESIPVRRDGRDAPTEATLGDRDSATVLTIPQNFNAAWSATMDGHRLTPQRVDGWKQGWLVPAGAAAVVHFDVPSDTTYRAGLLVGAGGLLAVLGVALVAGRRVSVLPPLPDGRTGWPDVAVCVGALGLLGGWAGVALVVGAAALCSRLRDQGPVGPVAAVLVLLSALQRVADPSWTHWLAQGATLSACALVAGSLLANGPTSFSRRKGRSSQR